MDYDSCYRTLGIRPGATLRQIHRAYKRLALKHHPDLAPNDPASHDAFIRVTQAYTTLRNAFHVKRRSQRAGHCRRCGVMGELFRGLDGGRYCAECLLGRRRKLLPMPRAQTISCLAAICLQGTALYFAAASFWHRDWHDAAAAMFLSMAALLAMSLNFWSADTIER